MAVDWNAYSHPEKKKEDENLFLKNLKGGADFLNPAALVPSLIGGLGGQALGTAKGLAQLPGSAIASQTGTPIEELKQSPLSFLVNTGQLEAAQADKPLAERASGVVNEVAPLVGGFANAVAETGVRGGAELASLGTRAQGNTTSAADLLKGTNAEGIDYGSKIQQGQVLPTAIQDLLTVAPAARGAAGGLEAAGAENAAGRLANLANAAEKAPLAPYTVPAKGLYNAFRSAEAGGSAFPRLAGEAPLAVEGSKLASVLGDRTLPSGLASTPIAEGGAPVLGAPARAAEALGQGVGKVFRESGMRDELLAQRAEALTEVKPQLNSIDETLKTFKKSGLESDHPLVKALETDRKAIEAGALDPATVEAKYQIIADAQKNAPEGAKLVGTDAYGKPVYGDQIATRKVPKGFTEEEINRAFKGLEPKQANNFLLKAYDKVTDAWRNGVLALNPAWQGNNIVQNSISAMTHGGVDPLWLKDNLGRIKNEIESGAELHGGSVGRGATAEFRNAAPAKTKVGQAFREKVLEKSYAANEVVDNYTHVGIALKAYDDLIAQGVEPDLARKMANKRALNVAGDFQNMSAAEKNGIKRVVPFYTWQKHAAKFTLREAMENPVRQLRLATVANKVNPQTQQQRAVGNGFLESALPIAGGKFLTVPGAQMEQGLLGGISESPFTNPATLLGATNPIIQTGLAAAGINAKKGRALETAPGQSPLSSAAGYATNLTPGSKMLADLIERSPLGAGVNEVKGDVRQPILAGKAPIAETKQDVGPIPAPLLKFLTGIQVDQPDLESQAARERKKSKSAAKQESNYNRYSKKKAK